jgi:hypothetical protein
MRVFNVGSCVGGGETECECVGCEAAYLGINHGILLQIFESQPPLWIWSTKCQHVIITLFFFFFKSAFVFRNM